MFKNGSEEGLLLVRAEPLGLAEEVSQRMVPPEATTADRLLAYSTARLTAATQSRGASPRTGTWVFGRTLAAGSITTGATALAQKCAEQR